MNVRRLERCLQDRCKRQFVFLALKLLLQAHWNSLHFLENEKQQTYGAKTRENN